MVLFQSIGRRFLFSLDPERAHELSLAALRSGVPLCRPAPASDRLRVTIAGIDFPNPLGLAAGYDKNGEVPDAALRLGFGFVECGTVTPLPQAGNPKPRLFRLEREGGVINRLGFNNEGQEALRERMRARPRRGIVGINIGVNRDTSDRIADYEAGIGALAGLASFLTINISSPNTVGLRTLQGGEHLDALLSRAIAARQAAGAATPLFLKIAPDLGPNQMEDIASAVKRHRIDGLVVSNTTLSRAGVSGPEAEAAGGLSGTPLFKRSTIVLARMRRLVGPELPIIGVGGVDSAAKAIEKIRAGADLVQLYTGMIFEGPGLPGMILRGLDRHAREHGLERLSQIRDSGVEEWATRPID
jgi:dihydroorotate dehydrogenase